MNPALWTALLLAATAAAMLLPLAPALIEWWRKTDTAPLRVVREQDTNIRHFAHSFCEQVSAIFERHGITASTPGAPFDEVWKGADRFHYTGTSIHPSLNEEELRTHLCNRLILAVAKLVLPDNMVFEQEIYAGGDLHTSRRNTLRTVYSGRRLSLGENTTIARWAHSCGPMRAAAGCRLYGRLSSDTLIALDPGVQFERLNAPIVQAGETWTARPPVSQRPLKSWIPGRDMHALDEKTILVPGNLKIGRGTRVDSSLVTRGSLQIAPGAIVTGSLKANGRLRIGAGTVVQGAIISKGPLRLDPGCRIHGPIISETSITITADCQVGNASHPTTVSAPLITLHGGCRVLGSVWASRAGRVVPAAQ